MKRIALMVEGITGLAQVILDALLNDEITCKVIVKYDGLKALDYLLCRGDYARRDPTPCPA